MPPKSMAGRRPPEIASIYGTLERIVTKRHRTLVKYEKRGASTATLLPLINQYMIFLQSVRSKIRYEPRNRERTPVEQEQENLCLQIYAMREYWKAELRKAGIREIYNKKMLKN